MIDIKLFLIKYKWQSFWIIISSLLINTLALCVALYVIQIFNRYLTYKLDSTLIALTIGVGLAFSIEIFLRILRGFLINKVANISNRDITLKNIKKATTYKIGKYSLFSNENFFSLLEIYFFIIL